MVINNRLKYGEIEISGNYKLRQTEEISRL